MKRAAFYRRTSTQNQENEQTVKIQLIELEKRLKENGNQLVDGCDYVDDGWSGGLLERPALDRLRQDIRDKKFDILYVYDRGRLARKLAYQEIVIEELANKEIEFVPIMDSEDPMTQQVLGLFYQFERAKIYERFRLGKLRKVNDGKLLGYNPLYGYDYVCKTKESEGYFKINGQEAETVKLIFHWVGNEGIPLREVVRRLYEKKIPPRKKKRDVWTKGPVNRILRNTTYIGKHYYQKTKAVIPEDEDQNHKYHRVQKHARRNRPEKEWILFDCPELAIVDEGLFYRVQKQLDLNKKHAPRNTRNEYLLQGLIYCPCGQKRTGEGITGHLYYRCTDRLHTFPLPSNCTNGGVNAKVVDTLVWNKTIGLITDENSIRKQAERWFDKTETIIRQEDRSTEAKKEMQTILEEENRYSIAYGKGIMPLGVYEQRTNELQSKRNQLKEKVKSSVGNKSAISKITPEVLSAEIMKEIRQLDFSDKKLIIRRLVNRVAADIHQVVISGNIPISNQYMELRNGDRYCWVT